MTLRPPQSHRGHNCRIAGTIRNDTEKLNLGWRLLESKLLAAEAARRQGASFYLSFNSGEVYRYFTWALERAPSLARSRHALLLEEEARDHRVRGRVGIGDPNSNMTFQVPDQIDSTTESRHGLGIEDCPTGVEHVDALRPSAAVGAPIE